MSGKSLKKVGAVIAKVVGMPEATVYERQRALVGAGMLHSDSDKKGPGSGVRASPEAAALLLAGIMATADGNIADIEDRTTKLMNLRVPSKSRVCSITHKKTFGEALVHILSMETLPRTVWLRCSMKLGRAIITAPSGDSDFGTKDEAGRGLFVEVALYEGVHQIAESLRG